MGPDSTRGQTHSAGLADDIGVAVHDDRQEDIDHCEAHEQEEDVAVHDAGDRVVHAHLRPQTGVAD